MVSGSFPPMPCGVGDYAFKLTQVLAALSLKVGVLTSTVEVKPPVAAGCHVEVFPAIKHWRLGDLWTFIKILRAWAPEIVHIQYPTQGYAGALMPSLLPLVSRLLGRKVVQTWHEIEAPKGKSLKYFLLRALTPGCVVVVRPRYKEQLSGFPRCVTRLKQFVHIPNGSVVPRIMLDASERTAARKRYLKQQRRLIVFFGFVYPHKGADLLFDIADPATDRIVVAGALQQNTKYGRDIMLRARSDSWNGNVDLLGFVPIAEISVLLSVADAVVLPFRDGGSGEWNSSLHAAVLHGCFVLTTSATKSGYDEANNIYYARMDDVPDMRRALLRYAGTRQTVAALTGEDEWKDIGVRHKKLYCEILGCSA